VADGRKTLEILLKGKNETRGAFRAVTAGAGSMANATIGHVGRVASSFLNLRNMIAGAAIGMAGKSIFEPALEMEAFTTQYRNLLGSVAEAKDRIEDLTQFSDWTPFEPEPIIKAGIMLDRFTRGAEDTLGMVRLVGDAASAVGKEHFSELAMWIGRAYAMIQGGEPIGEATRRLLELGVITPAVKSQVAALQAQNKSATQVWGVAVARCRVSGQACGAKWATGLCRHCRLRSRI